jgi:hypothetical protein
MWIVSGSDIERQYHEACQRVAAAGGAFTRAMLAAGDMHLRMRIRVADEYDKIVKGNDKFVDAALQKEINLAVKAGDQGGFWNTLESYSLIAHAGQTLFVYKGLSIISQGFVDVLRLGQGTFHEQSAKGVAKDALRLLSILPVGRAAGMVRNAATARRFASLPQQVGATMECTSNSAVRAMWLTRMRFFERVTDLWAKGGTAAPRNVITEGVWIKEVVPALKNVGATVTEVQTGSGSGLSPLSRVYNLAAANPKDAILFSVRGAKGVADWGHTMMASRFNGVVRIFDTTGKVFNSVQEFNKAYPAISGVQEIAIVHEARVLAEVQSAGGLLPFSQLMLPVVNRPVAPLVVDGMVRMAAQKKRAALNAAAKAPRSTELELRETSSLVFEDDRYVTKKSQYWTYRVQPGDSLRAISRRVFGSESRTADIAAMNAKVGPAPTYMIHPGQDLVLPDK